MPRDDAHHQPRAGAGIAEIERTVRRGQAADPAPGDNPFAAVARHARAEHFDSPRRGDHVACLEQPADPRLANRKGAEHERPMGNRLVSGYGGTALEGLRFRCSEHGHGGSCLLRPGKTGAARAALLRAIEQPPSAPVNSQSASSRLCVVCL
jgi:hypothetical protein